MELLSDVLTHLLADYSVEVRFPQLESVLYEMFESQCCQTLTKIKAIVEDDSLDDPDCFLKIEEIVRTLESIGSNGGFRHDFS